MANETREGRGMGRRHGKVKTSCVGRANELLPLGLQAAVAELEVRGRRRNASQTYIANARGAARDTGIASRRLARRS